MAIYRVMVISIMGYTPNINNKLHEINYIMDNQ